MENAQVWGILVHFCCCCCISPWFSSQKKPCSLERALTGSSSSSVIWKKENWNAKKKPQLLFLIAFVILFSPTVSNLRGETTTWGWGRREDETQPKTWFALHKIMHETTTRLGTSGRTLPGTQAARWIPKSFISRNALTRAGTLGVVVFLKEIRLHHPQSLKNNTERDLEGTSVCSSAFRPGFR